MRDDFRYWETIDVRWGDMDARGHVNNARYFTFSEMARMAYIRNLRQPDSGWHGDTGPGLVSVTTNFRQQVRHPATLEVGVRCSAIKGRTFVLDLEYYQVGVEGLVADGSAIMVWVDYTIPRSIALPEAFVDALEGFENRGLRTPD